MSAAAIATMSRAELAGAWAVHIHRQSGDREARVAVAMRARDLGMTQRDLAAEAYRGGMIGDDEMGEYR